jgi:hypothetical protein
MQSRPDQTSTLSPFFEDPFKIKASCRDAEWFGHLEVQPRISAEFTTKETSNLRIPGT